MKEIKISISDELYEELSNVPDMDSFLAELIENGLIATAGEGGSIDNDLTYPEEVAEDLPEEAYFELEDTFEEECMESGSDTEGDMIGDVVDDDPSSCDGSIAGPDDLDGRTELFIDLDLEDDFREETKPVPEMVSFSKEESNTSVESMACFKSIVVDLADRICELEKQIIEMNSNIRFLKDRSFLYEVADNKAEIGQVAEGTEEGIATERAEGSVPYATLSFPELKIPPELLEDLEVPSEGIVNQGPMDTKIGSVSMHVPEAADEEAPFPEPFSKPLLFDAEIPTQNPQTGLAVESPVRKEMPEVTVPDETALTTDKLASCIFAYLPSGSEVKKDVIKSLLSKRHADSEVESKIDQLLSAGRIFSIVKNDRVYLKRIPEIESA